MCEEISHGQQCGPVCVWGEVSHACGWGGGCYQLPLVQDTLQVLFL